MQRRNLLTGILGLSAAPAIVQASSLMPIWTPKHYLWAMPGKNDSVALWELINGRHVIDLKTGLSTEKLIGTGTRRMIEYLSYHKGEPVPRKDTAGLLAWSRTDNLLIYRHDPVLN